MLGPLGVPEVAVCPIGRERREAKSRHRLSKGSVAAENERWRKPNSPHHESAVALIEAERERDKESKGVSSDSDHAAERVRGPCRFERRSQPHQRYEPWARHITIVSGVRAVRE